MTFGSTVLIASLLQRPALGLQVQWSPRPGSNRRPLPYQGSALPAELRGPARGPSAAANVQRLCRKDRCPASIGLTMEIYDSESADAWWAGRESNPHSRRRLIYSQRSSPPAQPTHADRGRSIPKAALRLQPGGGPARRPAVQCRKGHKAEYLCVRWLDTE